MRVLLHGCNGKMGKVMARVIAETPDMEVVCGVDRTAQGVQDGNGLFSGRTVSSPAAEGLAGFPVYGSLADVPRPGDGPASDLDPGFDIVIDFSHHSALDSLLAFGLDRQVPLLICTTGFDPDEKAKMKAASERIPILHSANMSLGVNLLVSLVKEAAKVLADSFDIEIIEKHHNQKLDAPSGTALMIADSINDSLEGSLEYVYGRHSKTERRRRKDLGIHAVRGGAIAGEHNVIFAGQGEVVELTHSALSRDVFAYGALKAARFLVLQRAGLYSMEDVIRGGK
ncbi:MAG: 4-hydroxy-tetrahydrodipicolinate reductase [Bacillota bacterium]|jgi:4-hydroxy-tetrahydrodipicolinate reductase